MLYMIIEHYKQGCVELIYERARQKGRMLPDGLDYIDSWVSEDLATCYQLMSTTRPELLETWITHWTDLVDFEVVPVLASKKAAQLILGRSTNF